MELGEQPWLLFEPDEPLCELVGKSIFRLLCFPFCSSLLFVLEHDFKEETYDLADIFEIRGHETIEGNISVVVQSLEI